MGNLKRTGTLLAALTVGLTAAGCGEAPAPAETPRAASARVVLTVTPQGAAPLALIAYQGIDGRACHAFGTLTNRGPRVLDAIDEPLDVALGAHGRCLSDGGVSLATAQVGGGAVELVGGLAAKGVRGIVVGGERVRPSRSGAFLVARRSGGSLRGDVEVRYAGGGSERVPLDRLTEAHARD